MRLKHFLALAGGLAAFCAVAPAASAAEVAAPGKLVESGRLTYGTAATFRPFEYTVDGKLVGFDIELGAHMAKLMGLEPNPMPMDFKGLIPALQSGRMDLINSAMYIKPERAEQVDFVPYMRVGNEVIVRKGNPRGVNSRDDLCGAKVAVTLGGIQENYAREDDAKCKAAGKTGVEVMTFPTAQDSALAVRTGRADAFYNSTPGAIVQVAEAPDAYEIVGTTFAADTLIGFAVQKGNTDMKAAVEAALKAAVADGTYATLMKKYNLPEAVSLFNN
ncbi:MAG: transporter substrate-binding domain-containing protein [Rhizobiales bacterium]|nr:transporter substrate-binding domain-containing protein [Hyphomicrobiales bacterium]